MTHEITPIKVWMGRRLNGQADHPDWGLVNLNNITDQPIRGNGRHPDDFVMESWLYDKCCGHDDNKPGSPLGGRWGVRLVTPQFAFNAMQDLPADQYFITELTEAELEDFYDIHVMGHLSEEDVDEQVILALTAEINLRILLDDPPEVIEELKAKARKALDPDDRERGKHRNPRRHWAGLKELIESVIVPAATPPNRPDDPGPP